MPTRRVDKIDPIPSLRPKVQPPAKIEIFDCEQYSPEWWDVRLGLPTASNFAAIMASGEGRRKLLYQLAGEILTGEPAENYSNAAMQRGKDMEAEARAHYAFTREVQLTRVGFVRRTLPSGRFVGCSPDSLIGDAGMLEIKTMAPHLLIQLAESGRFPTEHRAQIHGSLWVSGRQTCDLSIFYRKMPIAPVYSVIRDEVYIREISNAIEIFDFELNGLVEKMRKMGGRR